MATNCTATNMVPSPGTWVVDPTAGKGNFTTITAAVAAASAGDTIYIRPGTYTENFTVSKSISLVGASQSQNITSNPVIILGKITNSSATLFNISNVTLQTNGDYCLSNTSTGTVYLLRCQILASNNIALQNSSTGTISVQYCNAVTTSPFAFFDNSSTGTLSFSWFEHTGSGATGISNTTGAVSFIDCNLGMNLSSSGAGSYTLDNTLITNSGSQITIDLNGSVTSVFRNCTLRNGAVLAIVNIQAGAIANIFNCVMTSAAASVVTGAGSLVYGGLSFSNTKNMTVSTQAVLPYNVIEGGTGRGTLTNHGVLVGAGTTAITQLSVGTNGQVLLGSTGADPAFGTLTSTGGTIAFTTGAGSLNLDVVSGGVPFTDVTGATQTLAVNNGYATDRGGGVTYTLPSTATFGDVIYIVGKAGLATIAQNANQKIIFGSSTTTVGAGGSLTSTNAGDCITLRCTTGGASTFWTVQSSVGNWTVV